MIIGGTGSLGYKLVKKYHTNNKIIIFSRDENKQWTMKLNYPNLTYIIGDMRNYNSVDKIIHEYLPNIIIISGALKHIDICEQNIDECINTNIIGVKNIIESVIKINNKNIETVVFVSTDKSCSPVNVYGMSKAISERIVAEASLKKGYTKFVCVRYGNVLNSRGSIIPKFKEIAENKDENSFPITDEYMTRFFMTLDQSVQLIETSILHGDNGDTWLPIIDAFKIYDVAKYFSDKYNKPIINMGIRPGEKIHECLINQSELYRTIKQKIPTSEGEEKMYYVIKPCYTKKYNNDIDREYTSEITSNISILKQLMETM